MINDKIDNISLLRFKLKVITTCDQITNSPQRFKTTLLLLFLLLISSLKIVELRYAYFIS